MLNVLRWLLVPPAAVLGWVLALVLGLLEIRVLDAFCPADQRVSGMCVAPWYTPAWHAAELAGAAVAGFLLVALSAATAPSHRLVVAWLAYAFGAAAAIYLALAATRFDALVASLVGGLLAVRLVWRLSRPGGVVRTGTGASMP